MWWSGWEVRRATRWRRMRWACAFRCVRMFWAVPWGRVACALLCAPALPVALAHAAEPARQAAESRVYGGAPAREPSAKPGSGDARGSDGPRFVQFAPEPDTLSPRVDFLPEVPSIDGRLDDELRHLPERALGLLYKSRDSNPVSPPRYRLGYGTTFFYLYIETDADSLTFRDRAFQHGDGFAFVLGRPHDDGSPTEEFYVLACSAVDRPEREWSRAVFWYYNVERIFVPVGRDTRMETHAEDGRISFELLLPWSEVPPYHPWITGDAAFHLAFTKAVGENERNRFTDLGDEVGAEMRPRRYARLCFAPPALESSLEETAGAPDQGSPGRISRRDKTINSGTVGPDAARTPRDGRSYGREPGTWQMYAAPTRRNTPIGDSLAVDVVGISAAPDTLAVTLRLLAGEGERLAARRREFTVGPGVFRKVFNMPLEESPPGAYRMQWASGDRRYQGETGLSILPLVDLASARTLEPGAIPEGSRTTLRFLAEEMEEDLRKLRPYETCGPVRKRLTELADMIEAGGRGVDPLKVEAANRPIFQRRAFLSRIDSTLQPYLARLPRGFADRRLVTAQADPMDRASAADGAGRLPADAGHGTRKEARSPGGKSPDRYPLLVFLHGSASDEMSLRPMTFLSEDRCLEIAPLGRGVSNAFAPPEAQIDIEEAIEDALRWFPCDPRRIILTGFSMGGYGVLRTFYEHPERYRALAIFAGGPDLGNRFARVHHPPDFTNPELLARFREVPVFVYHGARDMNVPFASTELLVQRLREAGAEVEFAVDPGKGHESPSPPIIARYHRWLDKVLAEPGAGGN